jgi:hypothetical protein
MDLGDYGLDYGAVALLGIKRHIAGYIVFRAWLFPSK